MTDVDWKAEIGTASTLLGVFGWIVKRRDDKLKQLDLKLNEYLKRAHERMSCSNIDRSQVISMAADLLALLGEDSPGAAKLQKAIADDVGFLKVRGLRETTIVEGFRTIEGASIPQKKKAGYKQKVWEQFGEWEKILVFFTTASLCEEKPDEWGRTAELLSQDDFLKRLIPSKFPDTPVLKRRAFSRLVAILVESPKQQWVMNKPRIPEDRIQALLADVDAKCSEGERL